MQTLYIAPTSTSVVPGRDYSKMSFCTQCGGSIGEHPVDRGQRGRGICIRCGAPLHDHPVVIVLCFVHCRSKLLWIKRRFDPRRGYWAAPGGFLESGESLAEGAVREVMEESGVLLEPDKLRFYMIGSLTHMNQVYVSYRAEVGTEACMPGDEARSVAFFCREELPWRKVAYPELNQWTNLIYDEIESRQFGTYHAEFTGSHCQLRPIAVDSALERGEVPRVNF